MIEFTDRWSKVIAVFLGTAFVCFIALRAYQLSFTFDESSTVLKYVNQPYGKIFSEAEKATNHILNTALTKVSCSLFTPSEFTYRLPNILAFTLYLLFSGLIVWRFTNLTPTLKLMGFILLNCNPYLLDFFSLCRGYGLALTFTLATIYFLLLHFKTRSLVALFWSLTSCCLAVLSNFSLLNLYLGICAIYSLNLVRDLVGRPTHSIRPIIYQLLLIAGISLFLFLAIREPLTELISTNELFFGGNTGIWQDTIRSLILKSTYSEKPTVGAVIAAKSMFIFLLAMIGIGCALVARTWKAAVPAKSLLVTLLWVVILVGLVAQHHLFGTRFLIERTALFLVPIFMLSFLLIVDDISNTVNETIRWILVFPSVFMFSHTVMSMNLTHTLDWKYEQGTKDLMESLATQNFDHSLYVGVNWPNTETFYFYKSYYQLNWMDIVEYPASQPVDDENFSPTRYDPKLNLAYVSRRDISKFSRTPLKIEEFPNNRILVWFQPPSFTKREHTGNWKPDQSKELKGDEYLGFISDSLSAYFNVEKRINLKAEVTLRALDKPIGSNINLVLYIDPNTYEAAQVQLSDNSESDHRIALYFQTDFPVKNALFDIYLWNVEQQSLKITDFKLTVFE